MSKNEKSPSLRKLAYDPKIRGFVFQVVLILLLVYGVYNMVANTGANLRAQGIPIGFGFLDSDAGFGILQTLIPYSETDSYARALWIGVLNTLLVAVTGIITATIIGFIFGIMRLSKNVIISSIATVYIEVLRNIPLLLQIVFIYVGVLGILPSARQSFSFGDAFFLNVKGFYMPAIQFGEGSIFGLFGLALAVILSVIVYKWAKNRQVKTGAQFPILRTVFALLIGLPLVGFLLSGWPLTVEYAELKGFNFKGGIRLLPEFIAIYVALSIYTAAFIAETVRAGILSVSYGQTEAASSLGLPRNRTLNLVIIPQALRVIVPPLTSQYLNLTKNSSLAVAIGFTDLFSIAGTTLNQTGQAIEVIAITMSVYLLFSLLTSAFMNWYNGRIKLVER